METNIHVLLYIVNFAGERHQRDILRAGSYVSTTSFMIAASIVAHGARRLHAGCVRPKPAHLRQITKAALCRESRPICGVVLPPGKRCVLCRPGTSPAAVAHRALAYRH